MSWAVTEQSVPSPLNAAGLVRLVEGPALSDLLTLADGMGLLPVPVASPGPAYRGRLAVVLEEAIELALIRRGACPPGVGAATSLQGSVADQLYRARLLEIRGLALRIPSLAGIASLSGVLDAEDSAVLRFWLDVTARVPVWLLVDPSNAELGVYGPPRPFRDLLDSSSPACDVGEGARVLSPEVGASVAAMELSERPPTVVERDGALAFEAALEDEGENYSHSPSMPEYHPGSAEPPPEPASVPLAADPLPEALQEVRNVQPHHELTPRGTQTPTVRRDPEGDAPLSSALPEDEVTARLVSRPQGAPEPSAPTESFRSLELQPMAPAGTEPLGDIAEAILRSLVESEALEEAESPVDEGPPPPSPRRPVPRPPRPPHSRPPAAEAQPAAPATDASAPEPAPEPTSTGEDGAGVDTTQKEPAESVAAAQEEPTALPTTAGAASPAREPEANPIPEPSRISVGPLYPKAAEQWRTWAAELSAARGAKPLAAIERMFVSSYVPLADAVMRGIADAEAEALVSRWAASFARSYEEAFDALRVRGKRPTMVLDVPDIALRIGRLHGARSVQLLLVDGLRFDLGLLVEQRVRAILGQQAALAERLLLWSALPSSTEVQLELIGRGPEGLAEPPRGQGFEIAVARGRAATSLRRVKAGHRELLKLDLLEARLSEPGPCEADRLDSLADETARILADHLSKQAPRTLVLAFGDHGFLLDPMDANSSATRAARQGGASPEEVLVPAFAWLVGGVH